MKLRFGKGSWLDLEHVPLEFGCRARNACFRGGCDARRRRAALVEQGRAAAVANRAVRQAFEKWVPETASVKERLEIAADKVKTAVFRDKSGVCASSIARSSSASSRLRPGCARRALLKKFGLQVRDRNPFHEDQIIAVDPKRKYIAERMIELANEFTETDEVIFAFPNFVSEFKRAAVAPTFNSRPMASRHRRGRRKAWAHTQGSGIVVAVLDDGVDVDHPNSEGQYSSQARSERPRDLLGRDFFVAESAPDHFDPRPKRFRAPFGVMAGNDIHGTPCAGVVAASGGVGKVRGVAPKARVLPVKVFHADDLATESRSGERDPLCLAVR